MSILIPRLTCLGSLAVFPSQESFQLQRALPETPSPPKVWEDTLCSQPEGRLSTQHAATVEEALRQPLMLPTGLEQRDGLAFISSYEEHIAPALSSSHKAHAQAQLCCK